MKKDSPFALYGRLVKESKNQIPLFVLCTLISGSAFFLIFSSVGVLLTQVVSMATNEAGTESMKKVVAYLLAIVAFALFSGFSLAGFIYIEQKVQSKLRAKMINSYLHTTEQTAENYPAAEILNRINYDLPETVKLIGYMISGWIFQPMISGLFSIILLVYVNWSVAILCILCTTINMLIMQFAADRLQRLNADITERKSDVIRFMRECLDGATELRTFKLFSFLNQKLDIKLSGVSNAIMRFRHYDSLRWACMVFFADGFTIIALLVLGALLASHGYIRFADIMLALPLSDQIGQMMTAFSYFPALIKQGSPNMQRVFSIIDLPQEETDKKSDIVQTFQSISFQDISFSYGKQQILNKLSFEIKAGERVAFIGESGSGKSTIIKLLLGLYLPNSGVIALGDQTLESSSLSKWRKNFAYMPQETSMFHLTIEENISLSTDADTEAVNIAARKANAEQFILQSSGGYKTFIGENNAGFSGGQIQRIALARCLFRDAPIILLDEPTSSLDLKSENLIKEAIEQLTRDKTIIVVTHRLNLIENFDKVYVVDKGCIIESGCHKELKKKGGRYSELWNLQSEDNFKQEVSN